MALSIFNKKALKKYIYSELLIVAAFPLLIPANFPLHMINNHRQRLSWDPLKRKIDMIQFATF